MNKFINPITIGASRLVQFVQKFLIAKDVKKQLSALPLPESNEASKQLERLKYLGRHPEVDARNDVFESKIGIPFRALLRSKHPAFENFLASLQDKPEVQIYLPNLKTKIAEITREAAGNKPR